MPQISAALASFFIHLCAGFNHPVDLVMEDLLASLDDPALPLLQWGDRFSAAATRLPARLVDQLEVCIRRCTYCTCTAE
jgi:Acetyl-CoA carboxylase, central region